MPTNLKLIQGLSHPLRIEILDSLDRRRSSPSRLAKALEVEVSRLTYHFKVLSDLELIQLVEAVPQRGSVEHIYEIAPPVFTRLLPRQKVRRALRGHAAAPVLQAMMDAGVAAIEAGALAGMDDTHLSYMSATLDEEGWEEVAAAIAESEERISLAKARSAKRLAATGSRGTVVTIVLAGLASPESVPTK